MSLTYINALESQYPNIVWSAIGDGTNYSDITWISGDSMPSQATLDVWIAANPNYDPYNIPPNIQQVQTGTFNTMSTNAVIPFDNTIPLITEGAEVFSIAFKPKYADSKILIKIQMFISHTASTQRFITGALFNGSTCIRSTILGNVAAVAGVLATIVNNQAGNASLEIVDTPNTTSSITYSFRVGSDVGSGTLYINQGTSGETFGTPGRGVYTITEIK